MTWEAVVRDVTAISYVQCSLYQQFHRGEEDVYGNIDSLYRKRYCQGTAISERAQSVCCQGALTTRVTSASHLPVDRKTF